MLRLMVITAHPDDEAASFGGTLLYYADRGVETSVLCLTPGQAASNRGGAKSDAELAAMRRQEFAAACEVLQVTRPLVLNYPDGQLHRQDFYRVVWEITRQVRSFRPHVMLAFGPEGGVTGHDDHSMTSLFATLAFHWAARSNRFPEQLEELPAHAAQKLYYATADFTLPGRQPITHSPATAMIDVAKYFPEKLRAFRAHTTQLPLWPLFEQNVSKREKREMFHLAASAKKPSVAENDLFDGVDET